MDGYTDDNSTFRVSKWAPANETEADLWFERSNIDGAVLSGVAYGMCSPLQSSLRVPLIVVGPGVHLTLYITCFILLWQQRKSRPMRSYVFLAFTSLSFVLATIGNAANTRFNEASIFSYTSPFNI